MKLKHIYDEVLSSTENVIKHSELNDKIIMEMKMMTSLYDYMDVFINYYDEDPHFNNWTDIEGMGYGWRWMRYPEEKWHDMMSRMVFEESNDLLRDVKDTYYLVYELDGVKVYHFMYCGFWRRDTIIRFSNEELDF